MKENKYMTKRNIPQKKVTDNGYSDLSLSSHAYFAARYENTHTAQISYDTKAIYETLPVPIPAQNRRLRHVQPVRVRVYADMLKIDSPEFMNGKRPRSTEWSGGGIRGDVVGFSRASRKRMIEFMAKVRDQGDMYFVTMTYDDWSWLKKADAHQDDFEAFRHRFERAFPNWKALWRVEVKERLSGDLIGSRVPHFHLLIWTGRNDDDETKRSNTAGLQAWGVRAWGEILQTENLHFSHYGFHVSPVRNRKHAYSYVSKYIGKRDDDDIACGRRWGRIGRFDTSHSETITLTEDEAVNLRRLIKRWLRNKSRAFSSKFAKYPVAKGYTIFGLGDTEGTGLKHGLFEGYNQFIVEVKRQSAEKEQRERTHFDAL